MNDESESVEGIEFFLRVTKRSTLSKCTRRNSYTLGHYHASIHI